MITASGHRVVQLLLGWLLVPVWAPGCQRSGQGDRVSRPLDSAVRIRPRPRVQLRSRPRVRPRMRPRPRAVPGVPVSAPWWQKRHAAKVARVKRGNVDLLWIGDSITHGWEQEGKAVWRRYYC